MELNKELPKKRGRKKKIYITTIPSSLNIDLSEEIICDTVKHDTSDFFDSLTEKKNDDLLKKNVLLNEKLKSVNIILDMYPSLKKDKTAILNAVLERKEEKKELYIVEKIKGLSFSAYFDTDGNIIDETTNLVGFTNKKKDQYYFFNNIDKSKDSLDELMHQFNKLK